MARTDLPKGFGGWQAIDSTPQEASESKFQVSFHKYVVSNLTLAQSFSRRND